MWVFVNLLRQGMKHMTIHLKILEIQALVNVGGKMAGSKASRDVPCQVSASVHQLNATGGASQHAFTLVLDGKSLAYALEDNMRSMFLEPEICCATVLCICYLLSVAAINTIMSIMGINLNLETCVEGCPATVGYSGKATHPISLGKVMRFAKMKSKIDSDDFSLLGIGGVKTAGDAIGINYFEDSAKGIGTELWDPGGPHYIASILSSFFFKIWDLRGNLPSAVMF